MISKSQYKLINIPKVQIRYFFLPIINLFLQRFQLGLHGSKIILSFLDVRFIATKFFLNLLKLSVLVRPNILLDLFIHIIQSIIMLVWEWRKKDGLDIRKNSSGCVIHHKLTCQDPVQMFSTVLQESYPHGHYRYAFALDQTQPAINHVSMVQAVPPTYAPSLCTPCK